MRKPFWLAASGGLVTGGYAEAESAIPQAFHLCPQCGRGTAGEELCGECRVIAKLLQDWRRARIRKNFFFTNLLMFSTFLLYAAVHLVAEWGHIVWNFLAGRAW
jgi:hypothetical protein